MKRFRLRKAGIALLCAVTLLGLSGCSDDDPPENVTGTWNMVISGIYNGQPFTYTESMIINQNGNAVSGSYSYDKVRYTFSGTYNDGRLDAVDSDNWTLYIDFEDENSAEGRMTGVYKQNGQPGVETIVLSR